MHAQDKPTKAATEKASYARVSKLILVAGVLGIPWLFMGYYALIQLIPFLAGLCLAMVVRNSKEGLVHRSAELLVVATLFVAGTSFLWWPLSILIGLTLVILGIPFCLGVAIPSEFLPRVTESQQCK